jgi:hypothetical protein
VVDLLTEQAIFFEDELGSQPRYGRNSLLTWLKKSKAQNELNWLSELLNWMTWR